MSENDVELRRHKVAEMAGKRERRLFDGHIELRDEGSGKLGFVGWACRTNVDYTIGSLDRGGFVEEVRTGSFRRSLGNNPDVVLVVQHGTALSGLPIARTRSGTLRLSEDAQGLKVDADLDVDDPDVQSLRRKFARGDLDGQMSFAFVVPPGGDQWSKDMKRRTITQAEIAGGDVSIVTFGANPHTSSELVARARAGDQSFSMGTMLANVRDRERLALLRLGITTERQSAASRSDRERLALLAARRPTRNR